MGAGQACERGSEQGNTMKHRNDNLPWAVSATGLLLAASFGWTAAAQDWVVPITSNSPHVVVSVTNERDPDDTNFYAINSSSPGGQSLPLSGAPHYEVFIYDTGSPAIILGNAAYQAYNITGAGRDGANVTPVGGVGGLVDAINSDPLGVYAAGFGAVTSTSPFQVDRDLMVGQYNDSLLYAPSPTDSLPNLFGTPVSSQYTTIIENSNPQILQLNGQTYRSPEVQLVELGSVARPSRRIGLSFQSGQSLPIPAFFPDFSNLDINDLGNNPSTPTVSGWFFLNAEVQNSGVTRSGLDMLFDTGAQGSFVSEQIAAEMGFDVENDAPDFVVRIAGVTGTSEEVPGFVAETFRLPGTDGGVVLHNVPLIVFNITDPRDNFSTLPGLLGMNVFGDRDLILNPEPGSAYLGVSDPILAGHRWASTDASADWAAAGNWSAEETPSINWFAEVRNLNGTPQVARISDRSTIGSLIVAGDGADGTMEVQIEGAELELYASAIVDRGGSLNLQNGTIHPLAVELRGGTLTGYGSVGGEVLSQGQLVPGGVGLIGHIDFEGSFDQLQQGTMFLELAGADEASYDHVTVAGATSLAGKLDLQALAPYSDPTDPGASQDFTLLASLGIVGAFDQVTYNGTVLEKEFTLADSEPSFRDHVGDGLFRWLTYTENEVVLSNYRALDGDADGDGEVQFSDFTRLAISFGNSGDWTQGDFDRDGLVQFGDFVLLANNFGRTAFSAAAAAASVPEPTACALLLGGLLLIYRRRDRSAPR